MRSRTVCQRVILTILFILPLSLASTGSAQFQDLVRRVPDGANALIMINVEAMLNSPLGKAEKWSEKLDQNFQAGLLMVPPDAGRFLAAAKLDFETVEPDWQVAIATLSHDPSMPEVAVRYRGTVDSIDGRPVAVLPGDMYAIRFGPRVAAIGFPADRQNVARWLRRIDNNSLLGLSPYLKEAQGFAENNAHVIMALDLENAIPAVVVRQRLEDLGVFEGRDVDLDAASKALASIRGVSLGITVGEHRSGAIKVDFNESIAPVKGIAKALLLEILAHRGAMITEFYEWEETVTDKQISLSGRLRKSGMQRLMSLLDAPPSLQTASKATAQQAPEQTDQERVVMASKQYFSSISTMLDDLRADKRNVKTMGQIGVWFGTYARKVDRLPILNVDQDLLQYGKFVSETLRNGQRSVAEAGGRSRNRQRDVPQQYDTYTYSQPIGVTWTGAYSWNGWYSTPNERRRGQLQSQVRTQERIRGSMDANIALQHIDDATADIRRHMTQKYNVEF